MIAKQVTIYTEQSDNVVIEKATEGQAFYFPNKAFILKVGDYITLRGRKTNEAGYTSCTAIITQHTKDHKYNNIVFCVIIRSSYNSMHSVGEVVKLNDYVISRLVSVITPNKDIRQTSKLKDYQKRLNKTLKYIVKEAEYYKYLNSIFLTNPTLDICLLFDSLYNKFKHLEKAEYPEKLKELHKVLLYKDILKGLSLIQTIMYYNPIVKNSIYYYVLGLNRGDKEATESYIFLIDNILEFAKNTFEYQQVRRIEKEAIESNN